MVKRLSSAVANVLRPYSARSIAWVGTLLIVLCGAAYIAYVRIVPPDIQDQSLRWPVYDKRWMLALFGLSIACVYAPRAIERLVDELRGVEVAQPAVTVTTSERSIGIRIAFALIVGFGIALLDGLTGLDALMPRGFDVHEFVHLSPLLKILQGGIPFVEARTQYGAGHQLLTYLVMTNTEFSLHGFRVWFVLSNVAIEGLKLALVLFAFGLRRGLVVVLLSLLFMPLDLLKFSGWFILARWFDPLVVGAVLPLIIWDSTGLRRSLVLVAALGVVSGCLAWISQENFSTGLVTGGLIFVAAFALGRLRIVQALSLLCAFAFSHVLVFLALMAMNTGADNLGTALGYAFGLGGLWAKGLANTPWSMPDSPWTLAFYASPSIVVGLTAIVMWLRREMDPRLERHRAQLVGMAAASASLIPITLLRSDESHFLGPATALPALIGLAILTIPALIAGRALYRESIRVAMVVALGAIYVFPLGTTAIATRLTPDLPGVRNGLSTLDDFVTTMGDNQHASPVDSRLGNAFPDSAAFRLLPNLTFGQFRTRMEDVRRVVGKRPTFIDLNWRHAGLTYFFADLTLTDAPPELATTLWLRSDLDDLMAKLAANPPECVLFGEEEFNPPGAPAATAEFRTSLTTFLKGLFDRPTVTPIWGGGTAWCKN